MKYIILFLISLNAYGLEKDYQYPWCKAQPGYISEKESIEVRIKAGRIDCLTTEYAIEVDYAPKFKNAYGQASWYSTVTGKKAGIMLIVGEGQEKYVDYLHEMMFEKGVHIRIWTVPK
jgi:hypothetical protein